MFLEGHLVYKTSGYEYPGTVVASFTNLAGARRYVVESSRSVGMLHIFSEAQLTLQPIHEKCGRCRHEWAKHEHEFRLLNRVVRECAEYAGMGNWCGCEEVVPESVHLRQTEVK